jgi:hypothetical protein
MIDYEVTINGDVYETRAQTPNGAASKMICCLFKYEYIDRFSEIGIVDMADTVQYILRHRNKNNKQTDISVVEVDNFKPQINLDDEGL